MSALPTSTASTKRTNPVQMESPRKKARQEKQIAPIIPCIPSMSKNLFATLAIQENKTSDNNNNNTSDNNNNTNTNSPNNSNREDSNDMLNGNYDENANEIANENESMTSPKAS